MLLSGAFLDSSRAGCASNSRLYVVGLAAAFNQFASPLT